MSDTSTRLIRLVAAGALVLVVSSCLSSAAPPPTPSSAHGGHDASASAVAETPAEVIARVITPTTYYNRLAFLSDDALKGRDTPSQGLEVAAAWLVSEHRRMGLEPGAADGSFQQRWPYRRLRPDLENTSLALVGPEGRIDIDLSRSAVRGASDEAIDGELVFIANPSGPPAPGSFAGKVVIAYVPGTFAQPWLQRLNQMNTIAEAGGARGSIIVVGPEFDEDAMTDLRSRFANPIWRMGMDFPRAQVVIHHDIAARAIAGFGDLADRAAGGESFTSDIAGARLEGRVPGEVVVDGRPANVVAILPGSNPALRDEYVVLSAHYDHVGIGTPMNGDSIYNGADDNGSGTVALLEVANALSQLDEGPRRSIAFVHVSGEEKGLLGASWFVDNPPMPIEQMVANINADMIGGDTHRDTLVVIGKTYSTLGPLVDELNAGMPELRITTSDDLWPEQRFFFRSDQFHFMRKEIPALFFFTGLHECYHRPCDEVERINIDKASRVVQLLAHAALEIANRDERPEWNPEGLAEVRQLTGGGR